MSILKKTMSVFVTLVLTLVVVGFLPQEAAEATTSSRTYYVYNAITGVQLNNRSYTLAPLSIPAGSGSSSTNSVIGSDDRVPDYTKSGVVKIITNSGFGSGFVVDDHTIATAAHCVKSQKISSILLFDTNGNIDLTANAVEYHIPANYASYSNTNYDYALITVKEDLSDYACFYLGNPLDAFISSQAALSVTGFPAEVNKKGVNDSQDKHCMYTGTGCVINYKGDDLSSNLGKIYYNADTSGGNSGGPVYITTSYFGTIFYTVVAIHTNGFDEKASSEKQYNKGTRITSDLLHFYLNNSNIVYDLSAS